MTAGGEPAKEPEEGNRREHRARVRVSTIGSCSALREQVGFGGAQTIAHCSTSGGLLTVSTSQPAGFPGLLQPLSGAVWGAQHPREPLFCLLSSELPVPLAGITHCSLCPC